MWLLKRKLVRAPLLSIVVAIPLVVWLQHWSNQPASTTIHIADYATSAAKPTPTYQPFRSKLFSSEVPYGWIIRKNSDTAVLSELVSYPNGSSINHGQVAVTVDLLSAGGLSAVPDYNVRTQDSTNYQRQATNLKGVSASFFDRNGPGYTVFMTRGSRYAIVTVSQFATPDEAYTLLKHVVADWKWAS